MSKNIVTIGGGTGTFVVLSGLRTLPAVHLSAVVTSADDGGSTGKLRDAYGFLPAGDARQALVALADDTLIMRELFAYRFAKGDVTGHNLGNLLITALTDLLGSDELAYEELSRILRVRGKVIPATDTPATLKAVLEDGTELIGESTISTMPKKPRAAIRELSFTTPLVLRSSAKDALSRADALILGPGRLYASTIAALIPTGMKEVVSQSKATLIYVANLFTSAGETDGYTLSTHVREVEKYAGRTVDHILVHNEPFSQEVLDWYANEGEYPITDDLKEDPRVLRASLAAMNVVPPLAHDPVRRSLMRHDSQKLKEVLASVL